MTTSIAYAIAMLTLTPGGVQAAFPSNYAYLVAPQPRLAGRVVTVSDHRIVVDTERGGRVALELDSGILSPVSRDPLMTVRAAGEAKGEAGYARPTAPAGSGTNAGPGASPVRPRERRPAVTRGAVVPTPTGPKRLPRVDGGDPEDPPPTANHRRLIAVLPLIAIGAMGAVAVGRRLYTTT